MQKEVCGTTFRHRLQRIYHTGEEVIRTYLHFKISRSAAALSYYLLMALFPLIMCVSIIVSQFRLSDSNILTFIESWITDDISTFTWKNTGSVSSAVVAFIIGMTLLVTSSSGAFRCLTYTAEEITGERRFKGLFGTVFSYLFAFILFMLVYASIFVTTLWQVLLDLLDSFITLPAAAYLIGNLRYVIIFAAIFFICFVLNFLMQPKDVNKRRLIPGTLFTSVGFSVATAYFSMFIRGSARYSLVYGSLASIVLLILWLNMCGNILMIGVIINSIIHRQTK
ncbi:MAG: YihY/virulence factor BrkB family protein [Clostridia bacterium]|nr:YihY/virulence factor BrkB family protein [Clostridia bacterium]